MEGSFETLKDYIVEYKHLIVEEPITELEKQILKKISMDAAETTDGQCGRESGFGNYKDQELRATAIYKLPSALRKELNDTNNIIAERNHSVFDRNSVVAKTRIYKFKAKGIRNDTVLQDSSFNLTTNSLMKKLAKLLNLREDKWTEEQKLLLNQRVQEKMEKTKNQNQRVQEEMEKTKNQSQYVHKLLVLCKTWNGPAISIEELESILSQHPDSEEKIVKTELTYFKHIHRSENIADTVQKIKMYCKFYKTTTKTKQM